MNETPLAQIHRDAGAVMVDFAGWNMPVRYGSDLAEHHAVRTAAGLFDLSHMAEIVISGSDAAAVVDYAFVSVLSAMRAGHARYSLMCNDDGGIIDDVIVYRRAKPDDVLVVANAANRDRVVDELQRRAGRLNAAANIDDVTADVALIAVQGPVAQRLLEPLTRTDAPMSALKYYRGTSATVAGVDVWLARTGYTGEDGFELFCASGDATSLWHALADAGGQQLVWCGLACRDTLRLEAGMPLYGNELDDTTTPFEVGLDRVVQFTSRDGHEHTFVGRDALRSIADGTPPTRLVGLAASGRRAPRAGNAIVLPGDDGDDAAVGTVTSGALSPTLGHPIAIGRVDTERVSNETSLAVDVRGKHLRVDQVPLPFYRRERATS